MKQMIAHYHFADGRCSFFVFCFLLGFSECGSEGVMDAPEQIFLLGGGAGIFYRFPRKAGMDVVDTNPGSSQVVGVELREFFPAIKDPSILAGRVPLLILIEEQYRSCQYIISR